MSLSLKSVKGKAKAQEVKETVKKQEVDEEKEKTTETETTGMKALITGGRGHLAKWVILAIEEAGVEVATYDIKDGQDIFNEALLDEKMAGVDVCIHMASYSRRGMVRDWEAYKALNVDGMIAVYNAANKAGVKKIIYVSSGNVYCFGDNIPSQDAIKLPIGADSTPKPEECDPYPRSLLTSERWLRGKANITKMQIIIMRPNNFAPTPPNILKTWHGSTLTKDRMAAYFAAAVTRKITGKYNIFDVIEPNKKYTASILAQEQLEKGASA